MKRCIISSSKFDQQWIEIGLDEDDRCELDSLLAKNPTAGDVIPKAKGFRKLRFELEDKGKRGGARIIYIDYCYYGKLYLAAAYKKSQKTDLSQDEITILNKMSVELKKQLQANAQDGK